MLVKLSKVTLFLYYIQMQKLIQAKNLSIEANKAFQNTNFKLAAAHYSHIVDILSDLLKSPFAQKNEVDIHEKIAKYVGLKKRAEQQLLHHIKKVNNDSLDKLVDQHVKMETFNKRDQIQKQKIQKVQGYSNRNQSVKNSKPNNNKNAQKHEEKNKHKSLDKPLPRPLINIPKMAQKQKKDEKRNSVQILPPVKKLDLQKKPQLHKIPLKKQKQIPIDPEIKDLIVKNIDVTFDDIVGLNQVKSILQQAVIRPRKRPDLYVGIRSPPRGLLLYGPPGNGKTYICKALAKESGCTFFALSASSILNKYVGQSQKMIKKIFTAAEKLAPSIIFIDEIDSMLTARSQNEHEASRRLKTEFLVLMDGINSPKSGEIIVIGATNLAKQLDNAAKRRFSKFIYIGHPGLEGRRQLLLRNLKGIQYDLSEKDLEFLAEKLEGFSASEIRNIIAETCMMPLRQIRQSKFQKIQKNQLRKVCLKDFSLVLADRKPIVSKQELQKYNSV